MQQQFTEVFPRTTGDALVGWESGCSIWWERSTIVGTGPSIIRMFCLPSSDSIIREYSTTRDGLSVPCWRWS